MNKIKILARKVKSSLLLAIAFITVYASPVFAAEGGNPLMDSAPVKGLIRFLNDATLLLLIVAPIVAGILIILFSILAACQSEPHDKEKWNKNRMTTIFALCWTFGASAVVAIITAYFK